MEDEVVIIEVKPEMFDVVNKPGKCTFRLNYIRDLYDVNQPITCRPEFLAIRDPAGIHIELLFRIDQVKSIFEKGQLVPQGEPIRVSIPLRAHNSTDEFTEEKSPIITRVITEDNKILCNGYYCIHFSYCKFFHHSEGPVIKTQTKN